VRFYDEQHPGEFCNIIVIGKLANVNEWETVMPTGDALDDENRHETLCTIWLVIVVPGRNASNKRKRRGEAAKKGAGSMVC